MLRFYSSCVDWPMIDVNKKGGLSDLINERVQITRRTFLGKIDREDLARLERELGYWRHPMQGLTMAADWHVEYFRSVHHGETVYGFRHSAIEYVFKGCGHRLHPCVVAGGKTCCQEAAERRSYRPRKA